MNRKKLLSLVLAVVMLFSMVPFVHGANPDGTTPEDWGLKWVFTNEKIDIKENGVVVGTRDVVKVAVHAKSANDRLRTMFALMVFDATVLKPIDGNGKDFSDSFMNTLRSAVDLSTSMVDTQTYEMFAQKGSGLIVAANGMSDPAGYGRIGGDTGYIALQAIMGSANVGHQPMTEYTESFYGYLGFVDGKGPEDLTKNSVRIPTAAERDAAPYTFIGLLMAENTRQLVMPTDTSDPTTVAAFDLEVENKLKIPADRSALQQLVNTAAAIEADEARYDEDSYKAFDEALEAARKILAADINDLTQQQVDAAYEALDDAMGNLDFKKADYTEFNANIAEFRALNAADYTTTTYNAAKTIIDDLDQNTDRDKLADDAGQQYVDDKAAEARAAIDSLVARNDVSELVKARNDLNNYTPDSSKYTPASIALFNAAKPGLIADADTIIADDENNYSDAQIAKQVTDIKAAYDLLKEIESQEDLIKKVEDLEAELLKTSVYTASSITAAKTALDKFKVDYVNVYKNDDATADQIKEMTDEIDRITGLLREKADVSQLQDLWDEFNGEIDTGDYTDASVAEAWKVLEDDGFDEDDIKEALKGDDEDLLNDVYASLQDAYKKLNLKPADYTAYDAAVAAANAKLVNESNYTDASVKTLKDALAVDVSNKTIRQQSEVDVATKAIEDATELVLKDADYTAYDAAVKAAKEKLAKGIWTAATAANLQAELDVVVSGKTILEQGDVDAQTAKIIAAADALVERAADYTAVDAAIAAVGTYTLSNYTDASVAKVTAAVNAVDRTLLVSDQDKVDAMATAITEALDKLVLKDADYSEYNALIAEYADELAEIASGKYTKDSTKEVTNILDQIRDDYTILEQDVLDELVAKLKEALENLDLVVLGDYSELDEIMKEIEEIIKNKDQYTEDTYNKLMDLYEKRGDYADLSADEQDLIDAYAKELREAIDALAKAGGTTPGGPGGNGNQGGSSTGDSVTIIVMGIILVAALGLAVISIKRKRDEITE